MSAASHSSAPSALESLLSRLGQNKTGSPRIFWLIGHSREDFESASDLIEALMARHPRVDFLLTSLQSATRAWLRKRFPEAIVLQPPLPFGFICSRHLINFNVRGLAILGQVTAGDRAALRAANRRALPAVVVESGLRSPTASTLGVVPEHLEHHFVASQEARACLLEAGVSGERVSELPSTGEARSRHFANVVSDLLMQDLKLIRSKQRPIRRRLERLALYCMDHPRLRRLLSVKAERFDTIEALNDALGHPETILCLGNGPTSEGPEVAQVQYDSLFRVNFLWLKRGFLAKPDMVFTGAKETLVRVRGAIFGLQSIRAEARLLVTRILNPSLGRRRYVTIERFGLFFSDSHLHDVRPTNGAAMLAVAVALQPARLVISGIDLFSHPDGTYPGDTTTPNAYTPGHDADSELALLLGALSHYKGELTILSPALRESWEAHKSSRVQRQDVD